MISFIGVDLIFEALKIEGAWLVHQERLADNRGFFARTVCAKEFSSHGLNGAFVQSSVSYNRLQGTFRGMHFQWPPYAEAKLVRCVTGTIHDILLDLRPESNTFLQHVQVPLSAASGTAVYIPPGIAHGFQTLADDTEVLYQMTEEFRANLTGGFRWNDPSFSISLPLPVTVISSRDSEHADFDHTKFVYDLRCER